MADIFHPTSGPLWTTDGFGYLGEYSIGPTDYGVRISEQAVSVPPVANGFTSFKLAVINAVVDPSKNWDAAYLAGPRAASLLSTVLGGYIDKLTPNIIVFSSKFADPDASVKTSLYERVITRLPDSLLRNYGVTVQQVTTASADHFLASSIELPQAQIDAIVTFLDTV